MTIIESILELQHCNNRNTLRSPRWESITEDRIRSNLSKTKNIPPKAVIFSDFKLTFAMSLTILLVLICSTKVSEKSDMAKF